MGVIELGSGDESRWESFLKGRPEALVFHHPAWTRALRAAHGYETLVLGHEDPAGRLDGVLPLVHKRGWMTGERLISLHATPEAGPVAESDEVAAVLVGVALERASGIGAHLELRTSAHMFEQLRPAAPRTRVFTTFVLELPDDPAALRFGSSRNHSTVKRAMNKARKMGVTLREAESERDLHAWHRLYLSTMRDHRSLPRPYSFLEALWSHLRPRGLLRLLLAEHEGRLLAGSLFLMFGATVVYAFNGRRREDLAMRPNELIHWHAIHDAAAAGFRRYDFGEANDEATGLARFKRKWGAKPERRLFYRLAPPPALDGDEPRFGPARRWSHAAWQYVPLDATERLGEFIYRRA